LLTERCQKSGWDRPSVDPKKGSEPNSWTASVTLRRKNPKSGESETVYMRPPPRQFPYSHVLFREKSCSVALTLEVSTAPSAIAVEKPSAMEAK
jgi:ATP-dependent RNA helicase DHX57